jgi:dienelactone hydrolase
MTRHEIALKKVVYEIAGADEVTVRQDLTYRDTGAGPLVMDVYYPPHHAAEAGLPAVVFVVGFPGPGTVARLGCAAKDMESYIGWAKLVAMSGAVAVTYAPGGEPAADLDALVQHLQANAASLGIDKQRIAVWACSGHGPTALTMLMHDAPSRAACAVLYYPYTIDLGDELGISQAAKMFGFVTPSAGRSADDLALNVPTFIVRAGLDQMPFLNAALDRFVNAALARNLPLTVVNHSTAPHAFDIADDTNASRAVIRQTLAFLQESLGA